MSQRLRARPRPGQRRWAALRSVATTTVLVAASLTWFAAVPASADTATVSNTTSIAVPATGSADQLGPGSPYPSPITVSGMTGTVSDLNVTLSGVTHGIAQDLDVLLVGPAGQNILLMSDVANGGGYSVNGTLTFDDAAAATIPTTGNVSSGTFRPTNANDGADAFPAPAPAPSSFAALTVFNGTDPNGQWRLFTVDDTSGDLGSIGGGWSMTITTAVTAQPGALQLTSSTFRGAEGGGPVAITLERVGGDDGAVSVRVTTTTPATATAGADFTALDQTVSFADGQTTASVPLTILDDAAVEGVDETVTVALSAPGGGATLGSPTSAVVTIDDNDATSDTTPITIPGSGTGSNAGAPAAPYPASIHVTGQPTRIGGVEVTLTGLTHTAPIDVDMLLVGPGGQNVVLMSDVGGQSGVSGITLTFSDAGSGPIPAAGPLTSGTYRASDTDADGTAGVDRFPAPAPAPSSATSLAAFVGTNPNGAWHLYIVDDASGDVGSATGWSLTFLPLVEADAGGPYVVDEGSPVTLDGSGTTAPAGATYAWDVDGDGQYDDATGPSPTVTAATLAGLSLGDGPAGPVTVGLQVTAGTTVRTDTTTLRVDNVAPDAAVATIPVIIVSGTSAELQLTATDPSAPDTAAGFTYRIDWGDGTPVQSVTGGASVLASHTWMTPGAVTVSVTATDKDSGTSAAATARVDVQPAVVADPGGPYPIDEGDPLTLDGTGSQAGPTATYAWDVDDDGQFDDATGVTAQLDPAALEALGLGDGPHGPVTVSLRVTEGTQSGEGSTTLTVANVAPTVQVTNLPTGVVAGTPAAVGFAAADPGAADTTAGFDYAVDWGDGSPVQTVHGGVTTSVSHTWAAAGTFTVSVTATDKDGGTSAPVTATVTVAPALAADAGGPYDIDEGEPLVLDGHAANAGAGATYAWDVDGDGQFDDATGATPVVGSATLEALGLGDGPASATVTLQVTDGTQVDTDDTTLDVANVAPTASVDVPADVVAGRSATVELAAADPSLADTADGFDYAVDWGDGSPVQTVTGGVGVSVEHTWASAGTVTVRVTATDKDGATSPAATADVVVAALTADAGGPYAIDEGDDLALDGSAAPAGPAAVYAWDLDDDGQFDDATGPSPVLAPDQLAALGLADGPADALPIRLQVTDGSQVSTDETTYEITNVAPVATVALPPRVVAGKPATVKVGAEDPSPTDAAAQFEYRVDWEDDGVVDAVVDGPADPPVTHTYATAGDVALSVVAVDKDGAASDPTVVTVTVAAAPNGGGGGGGNGGGGGGGGALPRTGASTEALAATAGGLVLVGLLVLVAARLRRRS